MRSRLLTGPAPVLALVAVAGVVGGLAGGLTDLEVYRAAGQALLDRAPLAGVRADTGLPFTYPPFAAVLMVPLAAVPAWVAAALWTGISVAALAMAVRLVLGELEHPRPGWLVALLSAASLALEPVWQNITFGQVNLVLMLAVLLDLLRPERRWSGVLVGLAAGVKLTPLVFVALLVVVGRRSAAARALLVFAATVAVGALAVPGSRDYWGSRLVDASRVGPPALAHNQSAYGALTRVLGHEPPLALWLAVAGTFVIVALVVAARWWRRGDRVLATCLAALAMLVGSPVAWSHHWVWALPLVLALWGRTRPLCLVVAATFAARPFVWLPYGDGRELDWDWWQQLVGEAYLWCAIGVVAWAARAEGADGAERATNATAPGLAAGGHSQAAPQRG